MVWQNTNVIDYTTKFFSQTHNSVIGDDSSKSYWTSGTMKCNGLDVYLVITKGSFATVTVSLVIIVASLTAAASFAAFL